ncbi:hypothetical protein PV325_012683, partial [Microctonus aethiopoides]
TCNDSKYRKVNNHDKAKRIKIVKRRTSSPSKPGTSNDKVVASGLSNPTNKLKPNKKNCMKKKIKCTSRERAEEDGDNFFLPNVMNRKKHAEETVEDINVIVTPNIHPSNDKIQNAVISVTIEEIRLHYTFLAEAQSSGTMRKRANAIMKGMWNKEERTQLVVKKNKRTPLEKREVTPRQYEKIRKICLVLQTHREIDQGPGKDNLSNLRQW